MTKFELYQTLYKAKAGHPAEDGQIKALMASADAKDYDSLERIVRDKGARFIFWLHTKTPLNGTPFEVLCAIADYCGVPRPEKPAPPEPRQRQRAAARSKAKRIMAEYKGNEYSNWKALIHDLRADHNCTPVSRFNSYKQETEHFIEYMDWFKGWRQCAPSEPGATRQKILLRCSVNVLPFANGVVQC